MNDVTPSRAVPEGKGGTGARRATRTLILDAAEALFAERGYHGVSLRDITQRAGVELALANYHFGPKEDLFRHVIARRVDEHCAGVIGELEAAVAAAPGGVASVEAIITAFCRYSFHKSATGGDGWKNYFKLLSRSSLSPVYEPVLEPLREPYGRVVRRYLAALQAALPGFRSGNLFSAFYYLQAVLTRLLSETDILDRQSRGLVPSADFDGHLARLVPFFAAGFYALAGQPELGTAARTASAATS
jgi:AcrR family transcriptional regulator